MGDRRLRSAEGHDVTECQLPGRDRRFGVDVPHARGAKRRSIQALLVECDARLSWFLQWRMSLVLFSWGVPCF